MNWKDRIEQHKMQKATEQAQIEALEKLLYSQHLEELSFVMNKLGIHEKLTGIRDEILEYGSIKVDTGFNPGWEVIINLGWVNLGKQVASIHSYIHAEFPLYVEEHSYGYWGASDWHDVHEASKIEWESSTCAKILVSKFVDESYGLSVSDSDYENYTSTIVVQDGLTFSSFDDPQVEEWLVSTLVRHAAEYRSYKPAVKRSYKSLKSLPKYDSHLIGDRAKNWLQNYESGSRDL